MIKYLFVSLVVIIFFNGCEFTIDKGKNFDFNVIDSSKSPSLIYKKGLIYCEIGSSTPFNGQGKVINQITENIKPYIIYTIKKGKREGFFTSFSQDGKVTKEGSYKNDKLEGLVKTYNYTNGGYTDTNIVLVHSIYSKGVRIEEKAFNANNILTRHYTKYYESGWMRDGWDINRNSWNDYKLFKDVYKNGKVISHTPYKF